MSYLLPARLHVAYNWTDAAGELDELRDLRDEALETYIRESVTNATDHDVMDVTAGDLYALHLWLREER